jgi:hypothetical protein
VITNNKNRANFITWIVSVFLLLVVITDFNYKLGRFLNLNTYRATLVLKAIMILTFLGLLIKKMLLEKTIIKSFFFLAILLLLNFLANYSLNLTEDAFYKVTYLQIQFLFGLLVLIFFNQFYKSIKPEPVIYIISVLVVINFLLIVIGQLFDLTIFKTYVTRFGFNGCFKNTSIASYFYMFVIILFHSRKRKYAYTLLVVSIISALFVGSKSLYFFLYLYGIYVAYTNIFKSFQKKKAKTYKAIFIVLATVLFFVLSLFVFMNNETMSRVYSEYGFITAFFSYRDHLFMSAYEEIIVNWGGLNYLIGGMGIISKTVEIDTIDLLLNYGILGFFVYIYVFLKNIFSYMNRNLLYIFIPIVASILLRGNFLYYPSVIYVSILIFVIINKNLTNAIHS